VFAVLGLGLAAGVASALPYKDIPALGPLQPFGIIVAIGVLIGAWVMRKYAEKHGGHDDDLRGLTGWVTVCGFIGAHVFDVLAYQPELLSSDPLILLKLWQGISSYGGFLGGAMGFAFYIWWKRLTPGMWADATAVGLLLAFSIGRIGCTLVHDHVGRAADHWLAFDYPRKALADRHILQEFASTEPIIRAWNLGLLELLYLIPVNITVIWLAFRGKARSAGFLAVLVGILYAPVRFFLEFWRLNDSDPRYLGLTFAQWCSIAAFSVAGLVAVKLLRSGKVAPLAQDLDGRPGGRKATFATLAAQGGRKPPKKEEAKVDDKKADDKKADDKKAEAKDDKADDKPDADADSDSDSDSGSSAKPVAKKPGGAGGGGGNKGKSKKKRR
jgi:phosphatidylglycerol---prolipoprotein diacylglyceryl transferase